MISLSYYNIYNISVNPRDYMRYEIMLILRHGNISKSHCIFCNGVNFDNKLNARLDQCVDCYWKYIHSGVYIGASDVLFTNSTDIIITRSDHVITTYITTVSEQGDHVTTVSEQGGQTRVKVNSTIKLKSSKINYFKSMNNKSNYPIIKDASLYHEVLSVLPRELIQIALLNWLRHEFINILESA